MGDALRVNGNQLSWGSLILKLDGEEYTGFTDVAFGETVERALAYGMGPHQAPRGRSRGKYTPDPLKITGWAGSVEIFCQALAAKSTSGKTYGDVEFTAVLQGVEANDRPVSIVFNRAVVTKRSGTFSEGADPLKEEIECSILNIVRNGITLFDSSKGTP